MKKEKRSKSTSTIRQPLQQFTHINHQYADLLHPLIEFKYKQSSSILPDNHKQYMNLLQVLKKFNEVLQKQANSYTLSEGKDVCEELYRFLEHEQEFQPYNIEYFISKFQEKQNGVKYYEEKLGELDTNSREKQYGKEIWQKTREMRIMGKQEEKQKIRQKNKLQKLLYEYNKEEKEVEKVKGNIIKCEIKLREMENRKKKK